jgi:hypothetical protein
MWKTSNLFGAVRRRHHDASFLFLARPFAAVQRRIFLGVV